MGDSIRKGLFIEEAKKRGYIVLTKGFFDFFVFNPKTNDFFWTEEKSRGYDLTEEQKIFRDALEKTGQKWAITYEGEWVNPIYPKSDGLFDIIDKQEIKERDVWIGKNWRSKGKKWREEHMLATHYSNSDPKGIDTSHMVLLRTNYKLR